jgi:hypothetical protein
MPAKKDEMRPMPKGETMTEPTDERMLELAGLLEASFMWAMKDGGRITLRIPADPNYDLDLLVTDAATAIRALVEGKRRAEEERNDLAESLRMELAENLTLFTELGLHTAEDFGHDTSTEAVRKRITALRADRDLLRARVEQLERKLSLTPLATVEGA